MTYTSVISVVSSAALVSVVESSIFNTNHTFTNTKIKKSHPKTLVIKLNRCNDI